MLHPHLHLLVPSSQDGLLLEARIYLPAAALEHACPPAHPQLAGLSTRVRSFPVRHDDFDRESVDKLQSLAIDGLVTAAHPWQKLGGNMLDPVLAQHLTSAVFSQRDRCAVVTFNCRGVGRSQGSTGWLGLNAVPGEKDFAAVEAYAIDLFRPKQVRRAGYSWGCVAALNAAQRLPVHSTLLISPPATLFSLTTLFASRTFSKALRDTTEVMIIHGTRDQFTGTSVYEPLARDGEVQCWVVDGADHFYRDEKSARRLTERISAWLEP